ncbi:MAG: hypothetical protein HPY45_03600 [Anaerolineae bacterium]|nr:hypothetical protein [Anaerolineae bacterium]
MQIRERAETLDTFVESVGEQDENIPSLRPQDMLMQLSEELRIPLRLNMEQMRLLMQGDQSTRDALNSQIETHLKAIHFRRLIAAIERRLEESLDIKPAQLATLDIDELSKHILTIVDTVFERRMERLLGEQGQITSELNSAIARTSGDMYTPSQINQWLILMTYGTRMAFDQRTHRKVMQRVMRLNYIYLAAKWLSQCSAEEVTERVLQHLETGLKVLQQARGAFEWNRLAQTETTLSQLDQHLQAHIKVEIGEDTYGHIATLPLTDITNQEIRAQIQKTLGWWQQNQVHRELFLRIISDQWVDYLTRVEALRVSIGMEAYAQRDPLVQYKSQATDMFKNLLNDIRTGIVSRLFTYQTMRASSILRESGEGQTAVPSPAADAVAASSPSSQTQSASAPKKKRKRH